MPDPAKHLNRDYMVFWKRKDAFEFIFLKVIFGFMMTLDTGMV